MAKIPLRKAKHPYETKEQMLQGLKRIEGQVRGIAKMIANDVYCDDILQQFSSANSALKSMQCNLLEAHIKGCITEQIRAGHLEAIKELMNTIKKMSR